MKKTALYSRHVEAGAKMVEFAGYMMPVQYKTGVISEHMATRKAAGMFDVSHMGEIILTGSNATGALQHLLTNDMSGMEPGSCRYSPMCNRNGGVVDDLIVYCINSEKYMLVVNAGNHDKDVEWIKQNLPQDAHTEDVSDKTGEIALQGPKAEAILSKLADSSRFPVKNYTFTESIRVAGINCLVSRTGYTGEDGFEIYCDGADSVALWDALAEAGAEHSLELCGLGARDTLRLEAGMPLYGHELNEEITPLEAGLGFFVKTDKPDFIGKQALAAKGEPVQRRTGLKITGRGIAREGATVYSGNVQIGTVTSGTQLPYMGYAAAMALVDSGMREFGSKVQLDVRGRMLEAEIVRLPFYKRGRD